MGRERNFFERTNFLGNLEIISWNISKFVRTYKLTKISGSLYVYTYKLPNILVSLYVRTNLLDVQTYSNIYIPVARIDEEYIQYELVKSRNCNMLHPFPSEQLLCWKLQPVGTLVQVGEAEMVKKEMALCQKPIWLVILTFLVYCLLTEQFFFNPAIWVIWFNQTYIGTQE